MLIIQHPVVKKCKLEGSHIKHSLWKRNTLILEDFIARSPFLFQNWDLIKLCQRKSLIRNCLQIVTRSRKNFLHQNVISFHSVHPRWRLPWDLMKDPSQNPITSSNTNISIPAAPAAIVTMRPVPLCFCPEFKSRCLHSTGSSIVHHLHGYKSMAAGFLFRRKRISLWI